MVEGLALAGNERVLEIGTGYGFQTAILAALARVVWSIERWPDLAEAARSNLNRRQINTAHVVVGDGTQGLAEQAPFDAIVVRSAEVPGERVTVIGDSGDGIGTVGAKPAIQGGNS